MEVSIGTKTDAGKRENNEDAILVLRPLAGELGADAIVIVADGMGGRAAGEEASALAVSSVRDTLLTLLKPGPNMPSYEDALGTAIRRANSAVYELARANTNSKGMGTTCVAAVFGREGAAIAHVGDSRAYILRDGLLRRLTEDHSYIHDQVKSGHLSDHDARHSRFRHVITKAIGIDASVKPDIHIYPVAKGDSLLICTDGMSNVVDEAGMVQIMSRARTAQEGIEYLVDAAIRGGSKDNVTGALVRIGVTEPIVEAQPNAAQEVASNLVKPADDAEPSRPRTDMRSLAWFFAGLLAGAVIVASVLLTVQHFRKSELRPGDSHTSQAVPPKQIDVSSLSYSAPRLLLVQTLVPNLIAGGESGVIVADEESGSLLSISGAGQVRPAGHIDPKGSEAGADRFMATDALGYVYVTTTGSRLIRRVNPDGTGEVSIARGLLTRPEALYVDKAENIYVIDDGHLNFIKASTAQLPTPPKPASASKQESN